MRNTLVTTLSASMLVLAALVAMPSDAQSQVIIIVGNGSAQPYYPPAYPFPRPYPYPQPYPHTGVVYGGGFYPGYGYPTSDYGYYNGYHGGGYGYSNGYYDGGYYSPY
jgi:hypothetical protein